MKPYGVTIQMKPLQQYSFVFQYIMKWNGEITGNQIFILVLLGRMSYICQVKCM